MHPMHHPHAPCRDQIALRSGDYFGEEACLLGVLARPYTAVCTTACELFSLTTQAAQEVVEKHPDLENELASLGGCKKREQVVGGYEAKAQLGGCNEVQ